MTEPVQYPSSTPRHALPLLFAGQSQKEFFVNAAMFQCDALLHPAIEGEVSAPPADPQDGEAWLVSETPAGEFAGHPGELAFRRQGDWTFAPPRDGMRVLDRATGQHLLCHDGWRRLDSIAAPVGGSVVDGEARAAIGAILSALAASGVLPEN